MSETPPVFATEEERQLAMLAALDELRKIIRVSIRANVRAATEKECDHAAVAMMIDMIVDGRLQVYLKPKATSEQ